MKRLVLLMMILLVTAGCVKNKNTAIKVPVNCENIHVSDTADYYLQDFDISMIDDKNTMNYEIVVDRNIVLRDHVFDVTNQHDSEEKITLEFADRGKYENRFKSPVISDLEINYTLHLSETGKYNVQLYPIYGVITDADTTIKIPLGVHVEVNHQPVEHKGIELRVTPIDGQLAFEVVNNTEKMLGIFDASIRLEKRSGLEWVNVPFAEGVGFCGNASPFDENGHYGPFVFEHWFESIESGEYRLSLIVSDDISIRDAKDSSRVYATILVDR